MLFRSEPVFRCLTMWEHGRAIRRPRRFERVLEFIGVKDEASRELVSGVILHFANPGDSLLCNTTGLHLQRDSVIDISHETLIWNWNRLRLWLRDETEAVGWYQSVVEDAMRYRSGSAGTWREPKLSCAQSYIRRGIWNEAWAQQYAPPDRNVSFQESVDFLARSVADQQRERRRQQRLNSAFAALTLAVVAAGAVTAWSWRKELAALDRLLATEKAIEQLQEEGRKAGDDLNASRQKIDELTSKLNQAGAAKESQLRAELASVTEQYQQIERRRNDYEAKVRQETAEQQKTDPLTNVRQSEYAALLARLTRLDNYNKALVTEHADLKRKAQSSVVYTEPRIVLQRAYSAQRLVVSGLVGPLGLFMDDAPNPSRAAQLFVITGGPPVPNFDTDPRLALRLAATLLKQGTCSGALVNNSRTGWCYTIPMGKPKGRPQILGPFSIGPRRFQLQVITAEVGAPLVSDCVLLVLYEVPPASSKTH